MALKQTVISLTWNGQPSQKTINMQSEQGLQNQSFLEDLEVLRTEEKSVNTERSTGKGRKLNKHSIFKLIDDELKRAKRLHRNWPDHVAAQAGIVVEEAGELMRAAINWKYERSGDPATEEEQRKAIREEAVHTAATAIRFLENF